MTANITVPGRFATCLRVLIPLLALVAYFAGFSWFLGWMSADQSSSVASVFAGKALKISLALLVASPLLLLAALRFGKPAGRDSGHRREFPGWGDSILILVPLTPVVQYVLNNQDILSLTGSLFLVLAFIFISSLFILGVPAALDRFGPLRPMVFLGLAFTFSVTNMASLSASRRWFEAGHLGWQLGIFGGVFFLGWLTSERVGRRVAYGAAVLYFVSGGATQLILAAQEGPEPIRPDVTSRLVQEIGSRKPIRESSIYLLVYDAYVPNETMRGYGIENGPQERYLEEQGFTLYPGIYSVSNNSAGTMSRVLNASMDLHGDLRHAVSGQGLVLNLLRNFGYETHGVFYNDYFFQAEGAHYDRSYPPPSLSAMMLMKAIFMGEFRFDVEFNNPSREEFLEYKARVLAQDPGRPRFIYMHDELPGHSQNSGECRPDETELFADRLERANREMKKNLEAIEKSDPDALIIVAGDHGPYLTKNCYVLGRDYELEEITRLDIQDRYGTFLAIRWPEGGPPEFDDLVVLQDLFPVVLSYLFEDPGLMETRVDPTTIRPRSISGATVVGGVIHGGRNSGEPMFLDRD